MKKIRFLAVTVAVALMVMGVGYALWSQAIEISVGGTLGTFDVNAIDAYAVDASGSRIANSGGISANVVEHGHKVQLDAGKMLPGDVQGFRVVFRNDGDCPAVLKNISFKRESSKDTAEGILVSIDGGAWVKLNDSQDLAKAKRLNPGDTLELSITVKLSSEAELPEQAKAFKFSAEALFGQP